jgi:hypothetical protein
MEKIHGVCQRSEIGEADLGGHASRMTRNMADTLKEAAGEVADAAFNPSPNSNT